MKVAASNVVGSLVAKDDLKSDYVIPDVLDTEFCQCVTDAVKEAAIRTGVNQI